MKIFVFILFFLPFCQVNASVVLKNTRVIYPAEKNEHTIQFSNNDAYPNIVQIWVDEGDEKSTPKTADSSFVIMPPIFKVNANGGQSARILYTGEPLAQDRESIFYLNFLVIPPNIESDSNRLSIVLRNRVKLFYRPNGIAGPPSEAIEKVTVQLGYERSGKLSSVTLNNRSGYFINLSRWSLTVDNEKYVFGPAMVEPFNDLLVESYLEKSISPEQENIDMFNYVYINDFGAQVSGSLEIAD
ncbi:hypothetical protein BZJ18_13585 [Salinivibrio sp. IB872]|nr:hypothetical protein BZJ18_13585 [Salinivibrio sp. IB872]